MKTKFNFLYFLMAFMAIVFAAAPEAYGGLDIFSLDAVDALGVTTPLMGITLASLTHTDGLNNTPGVAQKAIFMRLEDIDLDRFPRRAQPDPSSSGTFANLATITDNIYLLPDKDVYEVYLTPDKAEAISEMEGGDVDSQSSINRFPFSMPNTKENAGFIAWAKNAKLIWLIPDMNGEVLMFGNELYPARLRAGNTTTGMEGGSQRNLSAEVFYRDTDAAPRFLGTVQHTWAGSGLTEEEDLYFS